VNRNPSGPCKAVPAPGSWLALVLLAASAASSAAGAMQSDAPRLNAWPQGVPSPDFSLEDSRGTARTMRSFRGYVTLVTFGYANCPGPCSLELQKVAGAVRALGGRRSGVRVVFVTLDPERDSPELLDRFVHAFDPAFVALRGTAAQTDSATTRFSVENARLPGAQGYLIDHVIEEFIFDRDGRLRLIGAGNSSVEDVARGLSGLLQATGSQIPSAKK
jgi:protein SCO1/2